MNKLFYCISIICFLSIGCTSSSDKGLLEKASEGVKLGEAGTFNFVASDGLDITADYYPNENAKNIIILCHQADFSRGAYMQIAARLVDSGYACLALDLRNGGTVLDVENETAKRATEQGLSTNYIDALVDIKSAVDMVSENTSKEIYLWGSSYSASLALVAANGDDRIKKVIAFSPGEYFGNQSTIRPLLEGYETRTFITGSQAEYDIAVRPMLNNLPKWTTTSFKPDFPGDHGSKTLWDNSPTSDKMYVRVFRFLRN